MALRNLVEGQCGEGNPLLHVTSHLTHNKAHREEAFHRRPELHETYHENFPKQYDEPLNASQLAEEFISEDNSGLQSAPQTFKMDVLLNEMQQIESSREIALTGPPVPFMNWSEEYLPSVLKDVSDDNWSSEFLQQQAGGISKSADVREQWIEDFNARGVSTSPEQAAKWVEDFDLQEDNDLAATANKLLETLDNSKFAHTEFAKFVRQLGNEGGENNATNWSSEFLRDKETFSDEFLNEAAAAYSVGRSQKGDNWTEEYLDASKKGNFDNVTVDSEALTPKEREEFWQQLQHQWEGLSQDDQSDLHPWLSEFEAIDSDPFKEYKFAEKNDLRDRAKDPLADGKKCLELGDLPSAVLLFEAAVQKEPVNTEAWLLLGRTHAENEQDPAAISALRKCVELDPANRDAWMSLATSYTNESYQNFACHALKEWIKNSSEYSHLIQEETRSSSPKMLSASLAPRELIDEVRDLYLMAANLRPVEKFDCDIQCGLGVLLNLTGEYDKAIDCFQSALQVNPDNAQIWNKLGATLANSNRSTDAVDAYRRALEISPGFIRCRYNLGIACINLGVHREAADHFLEALNMQERSSSVSGAATASSVAVSDGIWTTLRICLTHLNLTHLVPALRDRDLDALNKEFRSNDHS